MAKPGGFQVNSSCGEKSTVAFLFPFLLPLFFLFLKLSFKQNLHLGKMHV